MLTQTTPDIPMIIRSDNIYCERRISPSWTVAHFKSRLEPITGIPTSHQQIVIQSNLDDNSGTKTVLESQDEDSSQLFRFGLRPYGEIHVTDTRPPGARADFTDVSAIPKYVMPKTEYESRTDSVLAWKKAQKLGRFNPDASGVERKREQAFQQEVDEKGITLNVRCQLLPSSDARRGTVRYVGSVPEILHGSSKTGGPWVGIELDEPTGKNDGSIGNVNNNGDADNTAGRGVRYFQCRPRHGIFVRPDRLEVGDFAVLDELGEDMEEI